MALILGLGLYGSTYLIPLFLQTVEGYSAGRAGLLLLPTGVVLGVASFVGGWLSDKLSAALLLVAGLLLWWREGDRLFTDGLIAAIVASSICLALDSPRNELSLPCKQEVQNALSGFSHVRRRRPR